MNCDTCSGRFDDSSDQEQWNGVFDRGRLVGALCPDCQTPEENAEAVINGATTDYTNITLTV